MAPIMCLFDRTNFDPRWLTMIAKSNYTFILIHGTKKWGLSSRSEKYSRLNRLQNFQWKRVVCNDWMTSLHCLLSFKIVSCRIGMPKLWVPCSSSDNVSSVSFLKKAFLYVYGVFCHWDICLLVRNFTGFLSIFYSIPPYWLGTNVQCIL